MVGLTRAILWITSVTAIIGIFAVLFAGLQWRSQSRQDDIADNQLALATNQFDFARKEASASSNETAASTDLAAKQAAAMSQMAQAAGKQADAAVKQATAASSMLAMAQQAKIDVSIDTKIYDGDAIRADGAITNSAEYAVEGTEYAAWTVLRADEAPERVWAYRNPHPKAVEVTQNSPHFVPMQLHGLDEEAWQYLAKRRGYAVFALRFKFKDGAGKTRVKEYCLMLTGPRGRPHPDECSTYKAQHGLARDE